MRKIISCDIHDHFEIACMRRSEVLLVLHDGKTIAGQAKDLVTKNKTEYFCIEVQDHKQRVNLIDIKTLTIGDGRAITVS